MADRLTQLQEAVNQVYCCSIAGILFDSYMLLCATEKYDILVIKYFL